VDRQEILAALTSLARELVGERSGLPVGWLNDAVKGFLGEDEDDVRPLADRLGLGNADQVLAVAERTFGDRLDAAARFFVEELFG
jgi:hypothetical protein